MKNSSYILFLGFVFFCYSIEAQVIWPLNNPNQQARVIGKVGEVRNSVRLHKGVDINNNAIADCTNGQCEIYAINAGIITWHNGGNWNQGTSYIRVGDVYYYHCKPTLSIRNSGSGMTEVEVGDYIGDMISTGAVHVHLQESNTNYLNQNINPYTDTENPTLTQNNTRFPNGYKIYKNGIRRTSTDTQLANSELNTTITREINGTDQEFKVIYSKIDLAVEIEDRGVSPTGGVTAGNSTPFGYEYQLQDYETPNTANPLYEYTLEFDQAPATAANNIVLHQYAQGYGVVDSHIITTHIRDLPYDRYFNTVLQEGLIDTWPNNNALNAEYNGNAEFPDNKYRIYIDAYDVDFSDNPNLRLANRIDVPVIIDNFLPYIKEVVVTSPLNPTLVIYKGRWEYANNVLSLIKDVNNSVSSNTPLTIKVTTSEPMTELKLTLGSQEYTFNEITDTYFNLNIDTPNVFAGVNTLQFEGRDLANNQLLTNPSLLPVKQASGNWPAGTTVGVDTWHQLNVSDGSGSFFGADFNIGGVCNNNNRSTANVNCLEICFQDTSTSSDITGWLWEFGDFSSSTSTSQNPSFTYSSPGTYDVTLTVTNTQNQTSTITKTITVDDCDAEIQAYITADATSGVAPLVVNFSDLSTGEIASRQWNILSEYVQYVTGNSSSTNIELSFPYSGTYQVSLDLEDDFGNPVTSNTIVINVASQPGTNLYVDFHTEGLIYTGNLIQFESEITEGCNNFNYQWTFYDYNGPHYSSLPNTTYAFPVPGNYTVELCVSDDCGNYKCVTKSINISNYTSNVFAQIGSNISTQNYIVEKGEPVVFYDYSQPVGNILYGSWFFDYHEGASGPDFFYYYPEPNLGTITHTYNEVGTYRVRLYVGENAAYFGSYDEKIITVVDEYDYLEIPTIHESNRQVFNNKKFEYLQTKNFDGNMLVQSRNYDSSGKHTSTSIEVYEKDGNDNYSLVSTIVEAIPVFIGNNTTIIDDIYSISGYKNKIAVIYVEEPKQLGAEIFDNDYRIEIYQKLGNSWSSFELMQTIRYDENTELLYTIPYHLKLYNNTLAISETKTNSDIDNNPITGDSYKTHNVSVYEMNNNSNLFEYRATLISGEPKLNTYWGQQDGFGSELDMDNQTIVVSESNDVVTHHPKKHVYSKTDIGWVNAIENARLTSSVSNTIDNDNDKGLSTYTSFLNNTILSFNNYLGIAIFEKPQNSDWVNAVDNAGLINYKDNIEDYNYGFHTGFGQQFILSDNNSYIVANGSSIRDFQNPNNPNQWRCLNLFYKNGTSWESKTKEDFRLYPLTVTPNEYTGQLVNEFNNKIVQSYYTNYIANTSLNSTILYTFDVTGDSGNGGFGICYENATIENQTINTLQPGAEGFDITIKNTDINNGGGVIYQATNSITIKPNTTIKSGANFKASIVDCNLINQ